MRVQRIKATWDGEIEFKSATNKWCTALTCARRKGWWQTRNEGRKQTCYQGLEREAEPFSNFLSAPKWKHKGEETALWKLGLFGWKAGRPVTDESVVGTLSVHQKSHGALQGYGSVTQWLISSIFRDRLFICTVYDKKPVCKGQLWFYRKTHGACNLCQQQNLI